MTAAIVRDSTVRSFFDAIVWVTLGYEADVIVAQSAIYAQLANGDEPPEAACRSADRMFEAMEKAAEDEYRG